MDAEPLKLQVSSKPAQDDLARFDAALNKTTASWEKFDAAIAAGATKVDASLKRSMGSLEKFAEVSALISKVRVSGGGADSLAKFAASMNAVARVKTIQPGQVASLQAFARAMTQVRVPVGAAKLAEFGRAMAEFKAPSASAIQRAQALFRTLSTFRPPASSIALGQLFRAVADLKVPPAASIQRLESLFKVFGNARAIPNAQAIAVSLNAVATAAQHAGAAAAASPAGFRAMATGAQAAQGRIGGLKTALSGLSSMGGRMNLGYQFGTLFTSLFSAFTIGQFVRNVGEATNSAMSLQKALFFMTGSTKDVGMGVTRFNKMVMDLGLNLKETQGPFARFLISAHEAGLSLASSEGVFKNVGMALRTVGATNEQTTQTFYALQEMLAKGKVQAKEFTRQLAQYIPGAAAFGAEALSKVRGYQVTIADFYAEMKKGSIQSGPFVQQFSEILKNQFESLQVLQQARPDYAINRAKNAMQLFYQAVGRSGAVEAATTQLNTFIGTVVKDGNLTPQFQRLANSIGRGFADIATKVGQGALWVVNHLDLVIGALKALAVLKLTSWAMDLVTGFGSAARGALSLVASQTTAASAARSQTAAIQAQNLALAANARAQTSAGAAGAAASAQRFGAGFAPAASGVFGRRGAGAAVSAVEGEFGAGGAAAAAGVRAGLGGASKGAFGAAAALMPLDLVPGLDAFVAALQAVLLVVGLATAAMSLFKGHTKDAADQAGTSAKSLDSAGNHIGTAFAVIGDVIKGFTFDPLMTALKGLGEFIGTVVGGIGKFISDAIDSTPILGAIVKRRIAEQQAKSAADAQALVGSKNAEANNNVFSAGQMMAEESLRQGQLDDEERTRTVTDQYGLPGAGGADAKLIASNANGLSPQLLKNIFAGESGGKGGQATNAKTGALGGYQFLPQTFLGLIKEYHDQFTGDMKQFADNAAKEIVNVSKSGQPPRYELKVYAGDSKSANARRDAILGYARNTAFATQAESLNLSAEGARVARGLGKSSLSNGELYALHNLGAHDSTAFIRAYEANPNADVSSVLSKAVINNNPSIYKTGGSSGRINSVAEAMQAMQRVANGKSALDPNADTADEAKKQAQATLAFYTTLQGATGSTALHAKVEQQKFDAQWAALTEQAKALRADGQAVPDDKALMGYKAQEQAILSEKLRREGSPLTYEQETGRQDLEIQRQRLAGLEDEAGWQSKLNELRRQQKVYSDADAEAAHKAFVENENLKRSLEAQAEAQTALIQAQVKMRALRADPLSGAILGEIASKGVGKTLDERIANSRRAVDPSTGVSQYDAIAQAERTKYMADVSATMTDLGGKLKGAQEKMGVPPALRAQFEDLRTTLVEITKLPADTAMAKLVSYAASLNGEMDGVKTNALDFAKSLTEANQQAASLQALRQLRTGIQNDTITAGMGSDQKRSFETYTSDLRQLLPNSDNLSTADLLALGETTQRTFGGVTKSVAEIARDLTAARDRLDNPPGFQKWAEGIEPLSKKLEDIKGQFASGLADVLTKALTGQGKKGDFKALINETATSMVKAQVENSMKEVVGRLSGGNKVSDLASLVAAGKAPASALAAQLAKTDPVGALQAKNADTFSTATMTFAQAVDTFAAKGAGFAPGSSVPAEGLGAPAAANDAAAVGAPAVAGQAATHTYAALAAAYNAPANTSEVMETARSMVGMNEHKDGGQLSGFFKSAAGLGLDPQKTAWCAAFVNAVLGQNGIQGTGSLSARSFQNFGAATTAPQVGDIAVMARGGDPSKGHVGFFDGYDAKGNPRILGGNQHGGQVNEESFPKSSVLSYRHYDGAQAPAGAANDNAAAQMGVQAQAAAVTAGSAQVSTGQGMFSIGQATMTAQVVNLNGAAAGGSSAAGSAQALAGALGGSSSMASAGVSGSVGDLTSAAIPDLTDLGASFPSITGMGDAGGPVVSDLTGPAMPDLTNLGASIPAITSAAPAAAGNPLSAIMGGLGKGATALLPMALSFLTGTKQKKPEVQKAINGIIGSRGSVNVTGTEVAGHANPWAQLLDTGLSVFTGGFGKGGGSSIGATLGNMGSSMSTNIGGGENMLTSLFGMFGGGSPVPSFSGGGLVGQHVNTQMVGADVFANAPRYHTGVANVSRDEHPSILHDDEAVVPLPNGRSIPVQMQGGGDAGGGDTHNHYNNMTVYAKDAESFRQSQGSIERRQNLQSKRSQARNLSGVG